MSTPAVTRHLPFPAALLTLAAATLLAACSAGPAAPAPASPTAPASPGSPSTSPGAVDQPSGSGDIGGESGGVIIDHPTGSTDVVLRVAQIGGFMQVERVMGRVPLFTLYGDGHVLLLPPDAPTPAGGGLNPGAGGAGGVVAGTALRETHIPESQVQALLAYALTTGGLGRAKDRYVGIMDLPTTVFELSADGVTRTVSVGGLSADPQPGPDAATLSALAMLSDRLRTVPTEQDYAPSTMVAVISETERDPGRKADAWPWPDLAPADFVPPKDSDAVPFPHHVLTAGQVAAVGTPVGPGGIEGLRYTGPDGKLYLAVVRPALPEEAGS
jgi:hypothetical protein